MDTKLKTALKSIPAKEREKIEKQARGVALGKMSDEEQIQILASAQFAKKTLKMVAGMNKKRPQLFSDEGALELLSKLGQWMNENDLSEDV